MTESAQPAYRFELREVLLALIRQQGLHDGIWALGVEFGFGAANFGETKESACPTAFAQIKNLGLTRVKAEGPLAIDAGKINPESKSIKKSVARARVKTKAEEPIKPARAGMKSTKKM